MENIKKEVCEPAAPYIVEAGKGSMFIKTQGVRQKESLNPYSIEEIHQMVAEGEKQFALGQWQDSEEMFRELEETLALEKH